MIADSILTKTDQWWKLIWAATGLLLANIAFVAAWIVGGIPRLVFPLLICGSIVSVASFLFACLAVRCPLCGARWFWQAIAKQAHNRWLLWLAKQHVCPGCREEFK